MTFLSRAAVSLAALALAAPSAFAVDLDAASRIARVTVYPDAADVTRLADVELPAGQTNLVFRNLPATLDPASLRVTGSGAGAITIGPVEARNASEQKPASEAARRIKALSEERDGIAAQLEGLESRKAMMQKFAESTPSELGSKDKPLDLSQWSAAWDAIGVGIARVNDEMRPMKARLAEIEREIDGLKQGARPNAQLLRDVLVSVEADSATRGEIALSYRTGGALWRPVYDARLDTKAAAMKPAIELVSRAQIVQRTGEDWSDVELTVATSRATRGASAPDMQPLRIGFWEPMPIPLARSAAPVAAPMIADAAKAEAEREMSKRVAAPPPQPAREQEATLEAGAFQALFRLPGRASVPGDGSSKNLRIHARALNADLTILAAPALNETAFLEARVANESDAPLLPGAVNVFRDGALAGVSQLKPVGLGESFTLGFGADESIRVARVPVRRKENDPSFLGSTKVETREFRTTAKNLHSFPVKLRIVDQVPFSENSAITVETLPQTTPPTEKQVGDRRGVMSWTLDLAAGEQKDVRLAYRMKWPADRDVTYVTVPVSPNAR